MTLKTIETTLEQYLRAEHDRGAIDFRLRAHVHPDGAVKFYIHPMGRDGLTLDFVVGGNGVSCITQVEADQVERATDIGTGA